jgi:hypothetical protein
MGRVLDTAKGHLKHVAVNLVNLKVRVKSPLGA